MRIYITDAQIPELTEFPLGARRILRRSAFQQMFARQRWLRWVPTGLCLIGALMGLLTFGMLPRTLYSWIDAQHNFVPTGYMLLIAALGGFIGAQLLTHRARRYLRDLIASDAHDKQTAA
jgi:hypothetical protein